MFLGRREDQRVYLLMHVREIPDDSKIGTVIDCLLMAYVVCEPPMSLMEGGWATKFRIRCVDHQ